MERVGHGALQHSCGPRQLNAYRKKGFENATENPLLGLLPPLIYIPAAGGEAAEWLASSLQLLAFEASLLRLGAKAVISRLTEIIFVQAVRI
jgi:Cupin